MVKFSRSQVLSVLPGLGDVEIRVRGEASGVWFSGVDTVRVLLASLKVTSFGMEVPRGPIFTVLGDDVYDGGARIGFEIPESGDVTLSIYNVEGRLIRRLIEGRLEANTYVADWDGRDDGGSKVAGGVYFLRLDTEKETATGKAVLVR
jgi:hypothetical protein